MGVRALIVQTYFSSRFRLNFVKDDDAKVGWNSKGIYLPKRACFDVKLIKGLGKK
jgi:hypothetical protein